MKKLLIPTLLISSLVFLLVSCGPQSGSESDASAPPQAAGTLRLNNGSTLAIDYVYLSPAALYTWGPNVLPGPLPPGMYYDVVNIPAGTYDAAARVVGTLSIYSGILYNFSITAGSTYQSFVVDASFTGSLKIVNNTVGANIIGLYVSPTGSPTWGSNQISSTIVPGNFYHMYDLSSGNYNVKVVWDVGSDSFFSATISSLTLTTLSVT